MIAKTEVSAGAEGEMVVGSSVEIELVGTRVVSLVSVAGSHYREDRRVGGDLDILNHRGAGAEPCHEWHGRLPAHRFLDRPRQQGTVALHSSVAFGNHRQRIDEVGHEARGC